MTAVIHRHLPKAKLEITYRHPIYNTWTLSVVAENIELEFTWGPLSGFGATDFLHAKDDDPNPFAPYEIGFESIEESEKYLVDHLKNHAPNQSLE